MSVETLLAYLIGHRAAIEQLAASPSAVWVGLAFLLSTGLARSYDTRDLRQKPWHLWLPFWAALALSAALYGAVYLFVALKDRPPPLLAGYWSLLGLFLLTAPLAWLYGIPFQRFLDARRAVRCRLATLGLVAAWRVALMTRALAVLLDDRIGAAFCLVLLVADVAVLVGLFLTRDRQGVAPTTPMLVSIMGGFEPPSVGRRQREAAACATALVVLLGVVTIPVCLWALGSAAVSAKNWNDLLATTSSAPPSWDVWALAGAAVVVFLALLPLGQRPQRLKSRIEGLLEQGQVGPALREMSAHPVSEFPPGWSPPPRANYREPPTLLDVWGAVLDVQPAAWVRAAYLERLREYVAEPLWYWYYDADLEQLVGLLARMPEGPELARAIQEVRKKLERTAEAFAEVRGRLADDDEERSAQARLGIHPAPVPTGRRPQIIEALQKLAEQGASS